MMLTVREVREKGFFLTASTLAKGCTLVESAEPFYYYNGCFCEAAEHALGMMKAANRDDETGRFCFTVAGDYHSNESKEFPYEVVDSQAYEALKTANESLRKAEATLERQRTAFQECARRHLPQFA